ncbi:MAG: hypothetical protein ACPHCJ_04040 [Oceanococcaceae bacterium]
MRFFASIAAAWLMTLSPAVGASDMGSGSYSLDGAIKGNYSEARCRLSFNKYGKVWTLRLIPSDAYGPAANLFFSTNFGPGKTGEYPIEFAYRTKEGTLGASVTSDDGMYSNETSGRVSFSRFDDRVAGTFSYSTQNREGASVAAKGDFDCPRGEALR